MGGEHHVSFHNMNRDPCSYIHKNVEKPTEIDQEITNFSETKNNILIYINDNSRYDENIERYKKQIEKWEIPQDIYLYWHSNDDEDFGNILHVIFNMLKLAYPNKICACFDRCYTLGTGGMDIYEYGIMNVNLLK